MQPGSLTTAEREQAAASVALYARWRAGCAHWRQRPYDRGTDAERRATCGDAIRQSLDRLGGIGAVW